MTFKTKTYFQAAGRLHLLPDPSSEARGQSKQCKATILSYNNKLTNGMYLLGF